MIIQSRIEFLRRIMSDVTNSTAKEHLVFVYGTLKKSECTFKIEFIYFSCLPQISQITPI